MNRYSIFSATGTVIVVVTYLFIFLIPGDKLSQYFQSDYYSGVIPRIFPIFLIFGDVFIAIVEPATIKMADDAISIILFLLMVVSGNRSPTAINTSPKIRNMGNILGITPE